MNKLVRISLLMILFAVLAAIPNAEAQRRSKKKKKKKKPAQDEYFDESGGFAHKLWYGGSLQLGFSNNIFFVGVSPMVGYKITDNLSIGPRFSINHASGKIPITFNSNALYRTTSFGAGLFGRFKFFQNFFLHTEYGAERLEEPISPLQYDIVKDKPRIITSKETITNFYIGGGYSSGGIIAYEIYLLYNVLDDLDSYRNPYDLRIGLTYNF